MEKLRGSLSSKSAAPAVAGGGSLFISAALGLSAYMMRGNGRIWKALAIGSAVVGVSSAPAAALAYKVFSGQSPVKIIPDDAGVVDDIEVVYGAASATIQMMDRGWTRWDDASPKDLRTAVQVLRQVHDGYESKRRFEGYYIRFRDGDTPSIHLQGYGGPRKAGSELSGVPTDQVAYRKSCLFCPDNKRVTPIEVFDDDTYSLKSLKGQLLVIPQEHLVHWFNAPEETQVALLQRAYAQRRANPSKRLSKKPVNLHCGSAGYQTVFHLHVRTGIKV